MIKHYYRRERLSSCSQMVLLATFRGILWCIKAVMQSKQTVEQHIVCTGIREKHVNCLKYGHGECVLDGGGVCAHRYQSEFTFIFKHILSLCCNWQL